MTRPGVDTVRTQVVRWERETADAETAESRRVSPDVQRAARLRHARAVLRDVRRYIDGEYPLIAKTLPGEKERPDGQDRDSTGAAAPGGDRA